MKNKKCFLCKKEVDESVDGYNEKIRIRPLSVYEIKKRPDPWFGIRFEFIICEKCATKTLKKSRRKGYTPFYKGDQ